MLCSVHFHPTEMYVAMLQGLRCHVISCLIQTCALKVAVVLGDVIHITSAHHDTLGEYHDIPHVLVEAESCLALTMYSITQFTVA